MPSIRGPCAVAVCRGFTVFDDRRCFCLEVGFAGCARNEFVGVEVGLGEMLKDAGTFILYFDKAIGLGWFVLGQLQVIKNV